MPHSHSIDEKDWPFKKPITAPTYSTIFVVKHGHPILTVAHDHEGDWQFLCGTTHDPDEMSIVCFGCMYDLNPTIADFSDLPRGWVAWRRDEHSEWHREPLDA